MNGTLKNIKTHNPIIGIPFIILACLSNAGMATITKLIAVEYNLPNQLVVFARFSISFLLLLPILFFFPKYRPIKETLRVKIWPVYLFRILFGLLAIYAYFYAIKTISLSNAVLLTYTSPLFIPIVLWVWKGIPVPPRLWIGLVTGFIGILFIVGPKFQKFHIGFIVGLLSGILAAISYITARVQSYNEKPICVNFYFFLGASLVSFLFTAKILLVHITTFTPKLWFLLFLLGVFGASFQGFLILGLRWVQVRFAGAFLYQTVGFAMFIDWFAFGMIPALSSVIGFAFIVAGAVLAAIFDHERQKALDQTPPT